MKTGRSDYDAMFRQTSVPEDEPRFVLRAQDACAADTVRCWAEMARGRGVDLAVVESALRAADDMEAWPTRKLPDAGFLPEHERLQLRYAFSRREWNWGAGSAEAIAYERGLAEGRRTPSPREPA